MHRPAAGSLSATVVKVSPGIRCIASVQPLRAEAQRRVITADLPLPSSCSSCRKQTIPRAEASPYKVREPIDSEYVWGLIWVERVNLSIALACAVVCTCSNLAAPVISGYLLEILAGRQPLELYPKLLGGLAVMYTVEPLLGRLYVSRALKAAEYVMTQIRMEVFRVLLMQPIAFYDRHSTTQITNTLSVDLEAVRSAAFGSVSRDRGLRAILEALGSITVLFVLCWRLAPVLATVIMGTGLAAAMYRKVAKGIESKLAAALGSLSTVAGQAFTNIRTVRAFAGENLERERFVGHVRTSYIAGIQTANAKAWLEAANRGAIHLSLVILFSLGGWLVVHGHMPLRVMLTGIGFTFSLMFATQGTINTLSDIRKATSAFQRVRELLNSTRAEPQVEAAMPPGEWWLQDQDRASYARRHRGPAAPPDYQNGSLHNGVHRRTPQKDYALPAAWPQGVGASGEVGSATTAAASAAENGTGKSNGNGKAAESAPVAAKGTTPLEPWLPKAQVPASVSNDDPMGQECPYPFRPMPDEVAKDCASGDIVLRDVSFSYPSRPDIQVLYDVGFKLPRGQVTALVGRSGAGKSTIVSLLSRFYAPDTGTITMGGMDIFAWSRDAWASSVAVVSQDSVLFSATIADNIAYGAPRASQESIEAAAKAANAHDFIMEFPDGYDTFVGETGIRLSGGQRQRVAIARALLKDAPMLILDEATSSLDMKSEELVRDALTRLVAGRTVLVIAHRLSTIQEADRVVVMANGRVAEEGTPADLKKRGGYYADLVDTTLALQV